MENDAAAPVQFKSNAKHRHWHTTEWIRTRGVSPTIRWNSKLMFQIINFGKRINFQSIHNWETRGEMKVNGTKYTKNLQYFFFVVLACVLSSAKLCSNSTNFNICMYNMTTMCKYVVQCSCTLPRRRCPISTVLKSQYMMVMLMFFEDSFVLFK